MRLLYTLIILSAIGCKHVNTIKPISYDGAYFAEDSQSIHYLEFSPDSIVKDLNLVGKNRDVKTIFEVPPQSINIGRFTLDLDSIRFLTKGELGDIIYQGVVTDSNSLYLHIHSLITDISYQDTFVFKKY
jgi:hypothetical protein